MDLPVVSSPTHCFLAFVFASLELLLSTAEAPIKGPFDICERDVFNGTCSSGQVILMESAMYGLMKPGTCIRQPITNNRNCDIDVTNIMDGFCSGTQTCAVRPTDPALIDIKPCPAYAAYLKASYKCLNTVNQQSYSCSSDTTISQDNGYLSSQQRHTNGPGTSYCPWTLEAEGGKRFVVSLLKFIPHKNSPLSSSSSVCFEIGTIQEGSVAQGILACGSDLRRKEVFRSSGDPVRIHFKDSTFLQDLGRFLLHFETIDCSDPVIPSGASFTRNGHVALVSCNNNQSPWQLTCENGRWSGDLGECSKDDDTSSVLTWVRANTKYSLGLLAIVTFGCAVVIFCGGFCIYVSIFYITRKRPNQSTANADYMTDIYKLQTMQRLKRPPSIAMYERTTSLPTPPGTMRRNTDYQRMNPVDPETMSHHSYVLYDHVPKPLPPIPIDMEKKHIYETPHRPDHS